jgi:hypothetical protein
MHAFGINRPARSGYSEILQRRLHNGMRLAWDGRRLGDRCRVAASCQAGCIVRVEQ